MLLPSVSDVDGDQIAGDLIVAQSNDGVRAYRYANRVIGNVRARDIHFGRMRQA